MEKKLDQIELILEETREAKLLKEKEQILSKVSSCTLNTLELKVAWILNNFPDTRNSDITLQLKYWEYFDSDLYNGISITPNTLYKLTRLTSLTRARAKIQNSFKLFLASEVIRKHRGVLAEEEKEKAIENQNVDNTISVYADESGKNDTFLIVGSVWFLDGYETFSTFKRIMDWKEKNDFKNEFHFKEINKSNLSKYIQFSEMIFSNMSALSFKAVSCPKRGISNTQDAFTRLFYHLLRSGIEHEDKTKRAPLPRALSFTKDAEEIGFDKLLIADIKDKIINLSQSQLKNLLFPDLDNFRIQDSKNNYLLQLADLFTASLNRIINKPGEGNNPKDEFASFFLGALNINDGIDSFDKQDDIAVILSI